MPSKADHRQENCVVGDWVRGVIVYPIRQVAGEMAILVAFTGIGVAVGAISAVRFIGNRLKGRT